MRNMYRPPSATQERLFSLEEIDAELAAHDVAVVGIARILLEDQRQSATSHQEEMSAVHRFISKNFGELRALNKIYDERSEALDTVERSINIAIEEDCYLPGYYETLARAFGVTYLINKAKIVLKEKQ